MSFQVYVLRSIKLNKIYIGVTSDLEARLKSHNELATKGWTIKFRPWIHVHCESFALKADAMKRERDLKTGKAGYSSGRKFYDNEYFLS
jgi:putative endonuclease